ncbi:MAG TPA: hypothetical protein VI757_08555 [Bacteroidia bacterium]|nr:hypothetical protein [Bacteroidia bacterium]
MAVYKFRVTFEEHDEVSRDIEIKATQSFEDLHNIILQSVGFNSKEMASFYMSDDFWKKGKEITLADMSDGEGKIAMMKNSRLKDFIADPHQKIYYVYDFMAMWTFHLELIKIIVSEETGIFYPRCVRTAGDAPKQFGIMPEVVPVPEDFVEEEVYAEEPETDVENEEEEEVLDTEKIKPDEFTITEPDAEEDAPSEGEEV